LGRVFAIEFGGAFTPEQSKARVRLTDGTSLNLDGFEYDGDQITMHSADLGELKLAANSIAELVIRPLPAKPPQPMAEKKLAQKANAAADPKAAEESQ
jgi:hypothetical protein